MPGSDSARGGAAQRRLPLLRRLALAVCAACLAFTACSTPPPQTFGYKPGVEPGMTKEQAEAVLGKAQQEAPFVLVNLSAFVMTYPFGQVLLEKGEVVAITVAQDQSYVGPFGITLGMPEDVMNSKFHAHRERRSGHRDSYDVLVGQSDTRTHDLYDQTDHLMIELAAANPNDPLAPFNVISITQANDAGLTLLTSITKAKVGGMYPDQHVVNYVSDSWSM
jgi:hypothetical protein